jgi:hypothetical protein
VEPESVPGDHLGELAARIRRSRRGLKAIVTNRSIAMGSTNPSL